MISNGLSHRDNGLRLSDRLGGQALAWKGPFDAIAFDEEGIRAGLQKLELPCYVVSVSGRIGVTNHGSLCLLESSHDEHTTLVASAPPLLPEQLGNPDFRAYHGVKYAYASGSMANGIASENLVIAMGRQKLLSSFGAAGLLPVRIEAAIARIQRELPQGPYALNLIHNPGEEQLERRVVELYLEHEITTIEASAFLTLTPHVVRYRAAGLSLNRYGQIEIKNKIIAKLSRREIAVQFLQPAPPAILRQLVEQGLITEQQANLASQVPMADDVTVEADSGGHTDNRPLVCLLPSMIALRNEIQEKFRYPTVVRVGAAGGIGTPESVLAAFMMGADYVVTGSVNQSCLEAGASRHTKQLLAQAAMTDVMMAPAADMFEMGVKVQLLKRGTLFPMRAQKLYELYRAHNALEEIPPEERDKLEKQIFRKSIDEVWKDTVAFFAERDPDQIRRANESPKRKMALVFRWYLGLSSRWSNAGEKGREMDYQIWCGPAMGAFNDWARNSYLELPDHRSVVDIAHHLMTGAAFLFRVQHLRAQGLQIPPHYAFYHPVPLKA
jgi:PfaD family protein